MVVLNLVMVVVMTWFLALDRYPSWGWVAFALCLAGNFAAVLLKLIG